MMSTPMQMQKDKEEDKVEQVVQPYKPPHGLINQGATCYLNSVLQVLFKTTEFHDRLDPQSQIDLQLRKIFEDLKENTCTTENITTTFGFENVYKQSDAADCLKIILYKVSRQAAEVFKGEMTHVTNCLEDHINEKTKQFWTFPLSIKDTPDTTFSVQNSFERMFEMKTCTGDNMVYCNECNKKTEATNRCEKVKAPQILILLLKRFGFDHNTKSRFKSDCCVEVPCDLKLENKTYKLYGMVNHMGTLTGGHYTATVLSEDNTWYECDDSYVSKVKHQLFAEDRTFTSRTVYLLTYRATTLNVSGEMKQNEEDEVQTRNDNEKLNHQTEGEEDNTEENSNKSEELRETNSKDSCERLDEEAVTERKEQGVTPPQRRHHGLYNQGATCYLNSVLQVLFMTTEIHDRLNQQPDQELREIFEDLKRKTCKTENITKSLKIQNVHEQRDAAECLREILHHISPQASEVFQGQLRDKTKCSKDHIINEETNLFWTLPLSLKDSNDTTYSVESSFKRTFQSKTYSSGNMVYCNDCKQKTEATSRCEMVEAPQILILLLKRFDFDYNTRSHFKSDCCVEVPCELQLKNKTYKLYGMVDHMGSLTGGHYTATVLSEDNTWYECNDSYVSKIKHQLFAEDRTFSSKTVYLLTYRVKDTELKMSGTMRQNEEDETRNDNDLLNHQTAGAEDHTEGNSNDKSEGLKSIKPSKRHLDEETSTEKEEQRAPKMPHVTTSPSQTADAAEQQDETWKVEDQMEAEVEDGSKDTEMDTDDEEKRQMGHSDVVTPPQRPHDDPNNQEASHSLNSVLKAPEMHDRIRTTEEDASLTVGEQDDRTQTEKEEQRDAERQKPDKTPSEDLTDEVEEEQGEEIRSEKLNEYKEPKAPEKPHVTASPRQTDDAAERQDETRRDVEMDSDDEEKRQMGHSDVAAESQLSSETNKLDDLRQDDVEPRRSSVERDADGENKGQVRKSDTDEVQKTSDEASNSQSGGEEGTAETGEIVLDDEVGSETEPVKSEEEQRSEADNASVNGDQQSKASISRCRRILNYFIRPFSRCICSNPVETTSEDDKREEEEEQKMLMLS